MGLQDDLKQQVAKIFRDSWSEREGQVVPEAENLALANDAVKLKATVLYADLSGSTKLVDNHEAYFAAEVYRTYLHCAAKIIRAHSGVITAYDGDRVMAVYIGSYKNTNAVKTALKINWARLNIINPALKTQYPSKDYRVEHVVGIDTSNLWVARTGIRGANDLVWVGRAANYAAKLSSLSKEYPTRITGDVYDVLADEGKTSFDGRSMWGEAKWTDMNNMRIYRSAWNWPVDNS